jgi:6-phosphogluconate dehydrogenase
MKIGFVGLGKMGGGMVGRLLKGGHQIVAFDPIEQALKEAEEKGAVPATSLKELVDQLDPPRAIWIMVPSGKPTRETITSLSHLLKGGDILID